MSHCHPGRSPCGRPEAARPPPGSIRPLSPTGGQTDTGSRCHPHGMAFATPAQANVTSPSKANWETRRPLHPSRHDTIYRRERGVWGENPLSLFHFVTSPFGELRAVSFVCSSAKPASLRHGRGQWAACRTGERSRAVACLELRERRDRKGPLAPTALQGPRDWHSRNPPRTDLRAPISSSHPR